MAVVGGVRYMCYTIRYHRDCDEDPGYGLEPALFFIALVAIAGVIIVANLVEAVR